jgi:hypothetical protein
VIVTLPSPQGDGQGDAFYRVKVLIIKHLSVKPSPVTLKVTLAEIFFLFPFFFYTVTQGDGYGLVLIIRHLAILGDG